MISRRTLFGITAGLGSACWLCGQSKVAIIALNVIVSDRMGRYIKGLTPSDFRVMEDGIVQEVFSFTAGNGAPMEVTTDGSMRPLTDPTVIAETRKAQPERTIEESDNTYTLAYYPDPVNRNEGFRKISVMLPGKDWLRVRSRAGYSKRG
jgi:hypothetical protein